MERKRTGEALPVLIKQENKNGPTLVYACGTGVCVLEQDGCYFKDLDKNGWLDPYEDWRLSPHERAKDLAGRLSVEQLAGLMLYSDYTLLPATLAPVSEDTYFGETYDENTTAPWEISDMQYDFITNNDGRHILVAQIKDEKTMVRWNNSVQALAESLPFGIPVNNATDPRHTLDISAEYNMSCGGGISIWPESPGLAASFDPKLAAAFGEIVSKDLRAMGFATLLGPQIDVGTEPRWMRYRGTFGQSPKLCTDMAKACCEGLQTSYGADEIFEGWGRNSVNAIVKHWPGGGTGEGGRDAHFDFGKYGVYPGNRMEEHIRVFTEGAFALDGGTGKAGGVMPYYTISYDQDKIGHENVGNAFSQYIIHDLLRVRYGYDGVICTDWKVTKDVTPKTPKEAPGRCWGMEEEKESTRHLRGILCGIDQFGGANNVEPLLEAYRTGCGALGEKTMRRRLERSAVRILTVMFRLGLFENPYADEGEAGNILHSREHRQAGYDAQLKSVVMVKNKGGIVPMRQSPTVYVPEKYIPESVDWFGVVHKARTELPVQAGLLEQYFERTKDPEKADVAIVFMDGPNSGFGFDSKDDGNGYVPISLQYSPYTAWEGRRESIASDACEKRRGGRSYYGKTAEAINKTDLDMVIEARKAMGTKPVIVSVNMMRPCVVKEFEALADVLFLHFGVEEQVIYDFITGKAKPTALLPVQIPSGMETVEKHMEDVPFDMEPHKDTEGHVYDFGFGMDFSGVIDDARVRKYKRGGTKQ